MQTVALTLAQNLELENQALLERDASLLTAIDHGDRLDEMQRRLDGANASGATTIAHYDFDAFDVSLLVPFGQQTGLSLGLRGRGTVTEERYAADGTLRTGAPRRSTRRSPCAAQPAIGGSSSPSCHRDATGPRRRNLAAARHPGRAGRRVSALPDLRRRQRIGIVRGDVAHRWYLPAMAGMADRVELVACCDPRREAAEAVMAAAEDLVAGAIAHTELDAFLAESRLDAVINLSPAPAHASVSQPCLEAGVHVYSEKPLAGTLAEADRLIEQPTTAAGCCCARQAWR